MDIDRAENGADRNAGRAARQRQLVLATISSISELGLGDTTLSSVTARAGLSHGTVNFHFKSKELLLVETLRFLAEEHHALWRQAVDKAGPKPDRRLLAIVETDFHPAICNEERLPVWFAFWGELRCRPMYQDVCGELDAERLEAFEDLVRRIDEDGAYGHGNAPRVARSLQCLIDGIWLNKLCEPEVFTQEEAVRTCRSFLAGWFPRHFA